MEKKRKEKKKKKKKKKKYRSIINFKKTRREKRWGRKEDIHRRSNRDALGGEQRGEGRGDYKILAKRIKMPGCKRIGTWESVHDKLARNSAAATLIKKSERERKRSRERRDHRR